MPNPPIAETARAPRPGAAHRRYRRSRWIGIGIVVAALAGVIGIVAAPDGAPPEPSRGSPAASPAPTTSAAPTALAAPTPLPAPTASRALAALATLPVKGRAAATGYSRTQFGQSWSDDVAVAGGHNGCDTRNDILRRDLTDVTIKPGTHACVVLSGTLHDPYSGTTVPFTRGAATSSAVQIDHIVALADAWQKGAQQLSLTRRTELANDPRNLQATVGSVNRRKSAADAATWLPPSTAYRCNYVARQVEVKAAYRLWVTVAEAAAMRRILERCRI